MEFLKRKVGPLTVRVWIALVLLAIAAAYVWRRYRGSPPPDEDEDFGEGGFQPVGTGEALLPVATQGLVFPGFPFPASPSAPDPAEGEGPPATPEDVKSIVAEQQCLGIQAQLGAAQRRKATLAARIKQIRGSGKMTPTKQARINRLRAEMLQINSRIAQLRAAAKVVCVD